MMVRAAMGSIYPSHESEQGGVDMKPNQYTVIFTDYSQMEFEAENFNHLSNMLEIHCLLTDKEVKSVELIKQYLEERHE